MPIGRSRRGRRPRATPRRDEAPSAAITRRARWVPEAVRTPVTRPLVEMGAVALVFSRVAPAEIALRARSSSRSARVRVRPEPEGQGISRRRPAPMRRMPSLRNQPGVVMSTPREWSSRTAWGVRPSPQIFSRGKDVFSRTRTSRPERARWVAAADPAGPAPTTMTSCITGAG
ncbi:hypothetical protein LUX39_14340 [Actinomadura madurae]|nr:hypothetical protein [Actinomadura madurae]MCP9966096.1 hypothetical protein [Actinomadura madurae]MCQ0009889.1 hypothetical protein [Actinomadura madurae]MCQ0014786.1 hypothetical protein [Actinomadura madurae]